MIRILTTIILLLMVFAPSAIAQRRSDNHQVTVAVQEITLVQTSSGVVNLQITGAGTPAGEDLLTTTDQSSSLLWGTNGSNRKITVVTNLSAPLFTLKALALNPTAGTPGPEATLSTTAFDFLRNIGRSTGSSTIRYTGVASATQGTGTDSHVITFTVQSQ
jgi:hypothetical protein